MRTILGLIIAFVSGVGYATYQPENKGVISQASFFQLSSFLAPRNTMADASKEIIKEQQDQIQDLTRQVFELQLQREDNKLQEIFYKIHSLKPNINHKLAQQTAQSIYNYSAAYDIAPNVFIAVARVESHFNPNATSEKGAKGMFQIMPFWGKECGNDLYDVDTSAKCSGYVLNNYRNRFKSMDMAIAAYYYGPSFVSKMLKKKAKLDYEYSNKINYYIDKLEKMEG